LNVGNQLGEVTTIPVPKGTQIVLDAAALHRNRELAPLRSVAATNGHPAARYWANPEEFRPDRFMEPDWPKDAFLPFSAGAHACLGRK
jgi:Cytochrome P450